MTTAPPVYRPQKALLSVCREIPGGVVLLRYHLLTLICSPWAKGAAKLIPPFIAADIDVQEESIRHELEILFQGGWIELEEIEIGRHTHLLANPTAKLTFLLASKHDEETERRLAWKQRNGYA